jgi:hypothetical protein
MQAPLPDLARTLELIYESKVFEISPVSQPLNNSTAYLQIKIVDGENRFETTVRYKSIEDNIQLRNLLTLLGN